jgi:hypothetical protein
VLKEMESRSGMNGVRVCRMDVDKKNEMDHTSLLMSRCQTYWIGSPVLHMSTRMPYNSEDIAEGTRRDTRTMELLPSE